MKTDYSTDDEDHDIQYTNSSPPPAIVIPNVLTNPVEDIPVQANGPRNDEQYNYPIIIASPTETATNNQPALNTHSTDHTEVQSPTSPVKLCGNPKQIATQMFFPFLYKVNIQI